MKNKELFYLALAIGGAFLIHKYMMKPNIVTKTANPVSPTPNFVPGENPILTQSIIKSLALNELAQSNFSSATSHIEPLNEYDVATTYQTLYGRSVSGMRKSCPTLI